MDLQTDILTAEVPPEAAGLRLDHSLVQLFPDYSRARLQTWLKDGHILVDGQKPKAKDKMMGGEQIVLQCVLEDLSHWPAQAGGGFAIIHEDADLIVIDKSAGLTVHPGAGQRDETLINYLLHLYPELRTLPRAGIIHRLDKNTAGVLVVARNLSAQIKLSEQCQRKDFKRLYEAIVWDKPSIQGVIDLPIARHPRERIKMSVQSQGRKARTHYRVLTYFESHSLLEIQLETGRTHQIRVHFSHMRYPLVGDKLYGGQRFAHKSYPASTKALLDTYPYQALYAKTLGLIHPLGHYCEWHAKSPQLFSDLLMSLRGTLSN